MDVKRQEEWLTSAEAAEYLGLSIRTLEHPKFREAIQSKLVRKAPTGRQRFYLKASLEEFKITRVRQRLIASRLKVTPHQFIFNVQEGAVTVTLPKQLGAQSQADVLDFLKLVLRQLLRNTDPA